MLAIPFYDLQANQIADIETSLGWIKEDTHLCNRIKVCII